MYEVKKNKHKTVLWLTLDKEEALSVGKKHKAKVYKGQELIEDYSRKK